MVAAVAAKVSFKKILLNLGVQDKPEPRSKNNILFKRDEILDFSRFLVFLLIYKGLPLCFDYSIFVILRLRIKNNLVFYKFYMVLYI
ncbi:MAG: hypothetical protein [Circular genetic element sp.]|nr:MAG: hypothetical protein [Circular genetic element sp.]